jgi:hypothetical protein
MSFWQRRVLIPGLLALAGGTAGCAEIGLEALAHLQAEGALSRARGAARGFDTAGGGSLH